MTLLESYKQQIATIYPTHTPQALKAFREWMFSLTKAQSAYINSVLGKTTTTLRNAIAATSLYKQEYRDVLDYVEANNILGTLTQNLTNPEYNELFYYTQYLMVPSRKELIDLPRGTDIYLHLTGVDDIWIYGQYDHVMVNGKVYLLNQPSGYSPDNYSLTNPNKNDSGRVYTVFQHIPDPRLSYEETPFS